MLDLLQYPETQGDLLARAAQANVSASLCGAAPHQLWTSPGHHRQRSHPHSNRSDHLRRDLAAPLLERRCCVYADCPSGLAGRRRISQKLSCVPRRRMPWTRAWLSCGGPMFHARALPCLRVAPLPACASRLCLPACASRPPPCLRVAPPLLARRASPWYQRFLGKTHNTEQLLFFEIDMFSL